MKKKRQSASLSSTVYRRYSAVDRNLSKKRTHSRVKQGSPLLTSTRIKFLVSTIIIVGFFIFMLNKQFVEVVVDQDKTINQQEVLDTANKILNEQYGVFSRNIYVFDDKKIVDGLKSKYHALTSVTLSKSDNQLVLDLTYENTTYQWQSNSLRYKLSSSGIVTDVASTEDVGLVIIDNAGVDVQLGTPVITAAALDFISSLITSVSRITEEEVGEVLIPNSIRQVDIKLASGLLIKFDTQRAAEEQLLDLEQTYRHLRGQSEMPKEYIDVRITGKAYYR